MKNKVVHYSKYISYSGTDRTAQLFCKYLLNNTDYDPYILYRKGTYDDRLDAMKSILGPDRVIGHDWIPGKRGKVAPYYPETDNIADVLAEIKPDIVHCHSSGTEEWPFFKWVYPKAKWVSTNIFGYSNIQSHVDHTVYICDYIKNLCMTAYRGTDGDVLYNPVELPKIDRVTARNFFIEHYNLSPDTVLIGRVGRADNFDPISLKAISQITNLKFIYFVVNPCAGWTDTIKQLGISDKVVCLPTIIDDHELSRFYSAMDIYAHARSDGEVCPVNIQEAMIHGLPIVSHYSPIHNGQVEIIRNCGFVVPNGNYMAYADVLKELILKQNLREEMGGRARMRASEVFEASKISTKLVDIYNKILL